MFDLCDRFQDLAEIYIHKMNLLRQQPTVQSIQAYAELITGLTKCAKKSNYLLTLISYTEGVTDGVAIRRATELRCLIVKIGLYPLRNVKMISLHRYRMLLLSIVNSTGRSTIYSTVPSLY